MPADSKPLVSVVVPTFNRAYCLARTVDSVLSQTHGNVEVLIVDDGSKDETRQMIAARYETDARVKYHYQENAGVVRARNHGFALAQGAFIALLDSDDVWLPWKLELQLAIMRQHPEVGMVWSDMVAVDAQGQITSKNYLRTMYHAWRHFTTTESLFGAGTTISDLARKTGGELPEVIASEQIPADAKYYVNNIFSQMILGSLVHTSTVLMRRERLELVKGFNVDFKTTGEDYDFHLRICQAGPVGFIDMSTILYQVGMADQLTNGTYRLDIALNCLHTIEPLIASGQGITLPAGMIRKRLAEVHAWVAYVMFDLGDLAGCRRHLLASLRQSPWQKQMWKLLFWSCFPVTFVAALRRISRQWKTLGRPRTESL